MSTQDLARAVEERLGRSVFVSPATAELSVEGSVQPAATPKTWRAIVRVRDEQGGLIGERELSTEGADCGELTEALTLVVALMIDPDAAMRDEPAPPEPAPEAQPEPSPRVEVRKETVYVPVPVDAPAQQRWPFEGGAGIVSGLGHLPTPNIGGAGSALLRPPGFWTVEAHGAAWWRSRAEHQGDAVDVGRWEGGLALCPFAGFENAGTYAFCFGGQLALLTSRRTANDAEKIPELVPEVAAIARGSLVLFDPIVLRLGLSGFIPLRRPRLYASDAAEATFRPGWIGGTVDFGLGVRLR